MEQELEHAGIKIRIIRDESPENPMEAFDCEPAMIVFYEGLTEYNDAPSLRDLVYALPESSFARGARLALLADYLPGYSLRDFANEKQRLGQSDRDTFAELLEYETEIPSSRSWSTAIEYFDLLESLASQAGTPCVNRQINGYTQGSETLVIAFGTHDWVKNTGIAPEHIESSLKGSIDLYRAWAFGDVYGWALEHEDDDYHESCWGYYGEPEKSGCIDDAKDAAEYLAGKIQDEAETLLSALCSAE